MVSGLPNGPIQYITVIERVKEVRLDGAADLDYWRAHLANTTLAPFNHAGNAQVTISATDLAWMGRRFRELVFSLTVSNDRAGGTPDAFYLLRAFNSSRLMAWMERTFFQTPYYPADLRIENKLPVGVKIENRPDFIFRAEMSGDRPPLRQQTEMWEGKIFLPRPRQTPAFFYAKLGGDTRTYPFTEFDRLTLDTPQMNSVIGWLRESNFTGQTWHIRDNALHARSKTYAGL